MSQTQPDGYLALPASGTGKPVLVLHPWWGLNATIKAFCDRLAEAGFTVFAPDLYHGKVTDQISEAEKLAKSLDDAQAKQDVSAAVSFVSERTGETAMAVIGFSLGAYYALELSGREPDHVHSVVLFYGIGEGDFANAKAEYLGHFAENDTYEPMDGVEWMKGELTKAGCTVTFHTYPGLGHWFFESDRTDAYDADASQLAWDRTLEFLNRS
jgi:carboxymethylenebutenolidase